MCKVTQEVKQTARNRAVTSFATQKGMDPNTVAQAVVGKGLKPNEQRAVIAQMGGQSKVVELRTRLTMS